MMNETASLKNAISWVIDSIDSEIEFSEIESVDLGSLGDFAEIYSFEVSDAPAAIAIVRQCRDFFWNRWGHNA